MSAFPVPETEQQRLATLHALQILDTPPEDRFDRITRLATTCFRVPIALVTLVDACRQWFKSVQGLTICETAREDSFCTHAIMEKEVLVVPDALRDPRFSENPLVLGEPYIRFYAGCPFYASDGSALGTLCIIDRQPRSLSQEECQMLQDMAHWVEHEINTVQISQALIQRENEVRLRAMMESTTEGMVLLSPDQRFLYANSRFSSMFDLPPGEFQEQAFSTLSSHFERVFANFTQLSALFPGFAAEEQQQISVFATQNWPQPRDIELFSAPVHTTTGEHLGRLYIFRDVTPEREVERLKADFVAQISHELHTPLTVIQGYIELLAEEQMGSVNTLQQQALVTCLQNTEQLARLVDDLLDFSHLESGRLRVHLKMMDLLPVLQHVVESLRPQITAKEQLLTFTAPATLPLVLGDADRLAQVFMNLLTNAHQYTAAGGQIYVRACVEDTQVRVDVQDTGRGLSPYEQGMIFVKFFRARPCSTEPGTGLGLNIARTLIEMHEGKITVNSIPGQGSTFSVFLPIPGKMNTETDLDLTALFN